MLGNRRSCQVGAVVFIVCTVACYPIKADVTRKITAEQVLEAWEKRQERVQSLRMEWNESFTQTGASLLISEEQLEDERLKAIKSDHLKTFTHDRGYTFSLLKNCVRVHVSGKRWVSRRGEFVDQPYTSVINEDESATHFDKGDSAKGAASEQSLGSIGRTFPEQANNHLEPVIMHFRPLVLSLSTLISRELTVLDRVGTVDGRRCVILQASRSPYAKVELWVDPSRDFLILRMVRTYTGKVASQFDISYDSNEVCGWVPSGWTGVGYNTTRGKLTDRIVSTVTLCQVNPPVDSSEFDYEFPPDTLVNDTRDDSFYVVRQDGTRRMVTEAELRGSVPYDALVETESGQGIANEDMDEHLHGGLAWSGVGCVVLMAILLVVRHRRRNATT